MPARILVLGKAGQLARALAALNSRDFEIVCAGRDQIDLASPASVAPLLDHHAPAAIINAAAYTAVDKAETDSAAAFALNCEAPARIAEICAERDLPLVHISTDYVFDGEKPSPYVETDAKNPQGAYGRSKSDGEDAVLASGARAAIIRTSWVYDAHGQNFMRTMLRLAQDRDEIRVVADQHGRPTWARDLAQAALQMSVMLIARDKNAEGVTHYAGAGDATWASFAQAVMNEAAKRNWPTAKITPITTADYPTPAKRPKNSRLDCARSTAMDIAPRDWRAALTACFDEMAARR